MSSHVYYDGIIRSVIRSISRLPTTAENYQNVRMEGLTRLQEHRLELQHRLDMHRTMEMPPSPSPSSRSLAPFSSASSSLSEGSNQPSGEDSASIVTGIHKYIRIPGLFFHVIYFSLSLSISIYLSIFLSVCRARQREYTRARRERERERERMRPSSAESRTPFIVEDSPPPSSRERSSSLYVRLGHAKRDPPYATL